MNVFLLYNNKDFDLQQELLWNSRELKQDLGLQAVFDSMARGQEFLQEVCPKVILCKEKPDRETIIYRQEILKDCITNPEVVMEILKMASEALEKEKNNYWGIFRNYPNSVLYRSVEVFEMFTGMLKKLKQIADDYGTQFKSAGFIRFFGMVKDELTEDYLDELDQHLAALRFRDGVLMSAKLGKGNKGTGYVLRKNKPVKRTWWQRIVRYFWPDISDSGKPGFTKSPDGNVSVYTFFINPRDEAGVRALGELKDEGINLVANSLARSDDHVLNFFKNLRTELAFYLGCLNLHQTLSTLEEPVCFPEVVESPQQIHQVNDLYDVCLALNTKKKVAGNDCNASEKKLVIVTGANQGGKSIFLRSVGVAQLMLQCGMFVPAFSFRGGLYNSVVTHFRREEDSGMKSGKLDEELARMNEIVEKLEPGSLILFNESFAATNEREGSEIARQIVSALIEHHVTVFFVTHLYEFAHTFFNQKQNHSLFLRAERKIDGARTYKISPGEPLQTSFGNDLYREVFSE